MYTYIYVYMYVKVCVCVCIYASVSMYTHVYTTMQGRISTNVWPVSWGAVVEPLRHMARVEIDLVGTESLE